MGARVASAEETIACERATMESGTSSAELMQRAGRAAAEIIASRFEKTMRNGAVIYAGSGNNGGGGWVVAEALSKSGFRVRVIEIGAPRSEEAIEAKTAALQTSSVSIEKSSRDASLVIDALLGTGSSGAPRGETASAISAINGLSASGATVVSLDLPSGLNATNGLHDGSVT